MPAPKTPVAAADILIELTDRPGRPIVLIERKNPPFGWALPGGFIDLGERAEGAAVREAKEETSLTVTLSALLGVYSDPKRDSRGHSLSTVWVAAATGDPKAGDDAANVRVFALDQLPRELAFDHAQILEDYKIYRETGRTPPPRQR
ncbi:MAG TPA: NUDIX hydrolase [Polyangiales bacterium]|nr:NUDIX hydrolase [Polyangiales bacterium]